MNTRATGKVWEDVVARYLRRAGMVIYVQNFRCRQGEIDIIGEQDGCLVFVEVKYRNSSVYGSPEEAVGWRKQEKICRCALSYLYEYGKMRQPVRFDVVCIAQGRIRWYRNAFPFRGKGGIWN